MTVEGAPDSIAAPDVTADWLLSSAERGNPATAIDAEHVDARAWTIGNHVTVHVDGAAYFARLHQLLSGLDAGDWVYLTDWRIDATRQLVGPGSELGPLLAELARRGVAIRGLLWRSHPAVMRFNQDANRVMGTLVNRAGGQLVADQRVRRFGSHHQKLLVVHTPNRTGRCLAFVGGIDLSRGRHDTPEHLGDRDPVRIDRRYGPHPPWHDLQLELQGPAVLDVDLTFRERWEDRTPPDHRIQYSAEAGAILGRAPLTQRHLLAAYGRDIGAAFQIADDLLDVEGTTEETGKTAGKDQEAGKATMVAVLGVERARSHADLLARQAAGHLEGFGERAANLRALAAFVVERRS